MQGVNVKQLYWICFALMIVVYSLYNVYLVDVKDYYAISRRMRHVYKFLSVVAIYGIGTAGLRKYAAVWAVLIWHTVYAVAIVILLVLGLYTWFIGQLAMGIHNMADTLLQLLISPLFYVAAGILINRLGGNARKA